MTLIYTLQFYVCDACYITYQQHMWHAGRQQTQNSKNCSSQASSTWQGIRLIHMIGSSDVIYSDIKTVRGITLSWRHDYRDKAKTRVWPTNTSGALHYSDSDEQGSASVQRLTRNSLWSLRAAEQNTNRISSSRRNSSPKNCRKAWSVKAMLYIRQEADASISWSTLNNSQQYYHSLLLVFFIYFTISLCFIYRAALLIGKGSLLELSVKAQGPHNSP